MREIRNGDMYLKNSSQIVIIHGYKPAADAGANMYITAVFGDCYSGNFGVGGKDDTLLKIAEGKCTYIGNLSDIFRELL